MNQGTVLKPTEIQPVKSHVQNDIVIPASMGDLQNKLQELGVQDGFVILWQVNSINWGRWTDGRFYYEGPAPKDSLVLELRVFNEQEELHLLKKGGSFKGRYRKDGEGEEAEYIDSASRFWGKRTEGQESAEGFICLIDKDRKLSMSIPKIEADAETYALETRSYVGINEQTAQAGYVDYRFKAILPVFVKGDAQ